MTQFAARNTPTGAGGFVSGTLAGAQLLRDVVAIPAGANAAWLQADADVGMRMDGIAGGDYQALPAGTFLPLTNRTQMDLLVLNGSAQVRVQFFYGTVGPMAHAPIAGNGGGPPPVPPLTELVTQNVVHVMWSGDDDTGQRDRLDLPFRTIDAAVEVIGDGDTLYVWPGPYFLDETVVLSGVNIVLLGASVYAPDDDVAFELTGTSGDTSPCGIVGLGQAFVYGSDPASPVIYAVSGGEYFRGVRIAHEAGGVGLQLGYAGGGAPIVDECDITITGAGGIGIVAEGPALISATINAAAIGVHSPSGSTGSVVVNGTITCSGVGALCEAAGVTQTIYADITATAGTGARATAGRQLVFGAVSFPSDGVGVRCDGGDQLVYAQILRNSSVPTSNSALYCTSGRQVFYGVAAAPFGGSANARCTGGTQLLYGAVDEAVCAGGYQEVHSASTVWAGNGKQRVLGRVSAAAHISTGGNMVVAGQVDVPITMDDVTSRLLLEATARLYGSPSVDDVNTVSPTLYSCGAYAKYAPDGTITVGGVLNVDAAIPLP